MLDKISWLGHDGFKIAASKTIYIDPYQLSGKLEPADVICITHDHYDHCSPEDLAKIREDHTVVIAAANCKSKIEGDVRWVSAGTKVTIDDLAVEAVPAYNVNKPSHPRQAGGVGYLLRIEGTTIYHAGDTDPIPEMERLGAVDIAMLPVSGVYVATAEEAVEAANKIKPKVVIPMHYGTIVGSRADAERFKELWSGEVVILEAQSS
jgi:L-ascorbate metabolism protein UlaG (beta-lactamase superfamily)